MTPVPYLGAQKYYPLGPLGGACTRGSQRILVSWFGLHGHSLGAVPQPRLHPHQVFIAGILGEAQTCVCSPSSTRDSSDLKGQLLAWKFWLLRKKLPAHVAVVRGKERESTTECIWEDTTTLFELCRSRDMNLLLASITKWEDIGLYSGHYSGVFIAPENARNAETKHQSEAVPNPTTSLIGFDD
jgi:hypothetical protein